jgi:hypothetical protein
VSKRIVLTLVSALFVLALAGSASAGPAKQAKLGPNTKARSAAEDEAVVLPSRVATAIRRAQNSFAKAEEHVDEAEYKTALISLRAVLNWVTAADKAARRQMNAVPADPEAETTSGPDSVVAVLTMDQGIVVGLAALLNGQPGLLDGPIGTTLAGVQSTRDKLLDAVIALDPVGAGAVYADAMADTVDGYADEVANLSEALQDDTLTAGGKSALTAALARSQATLAKINTAFGGGE